MSYRWIFRSIDDAETLPELQRALNDLPRSLARALMLRGVTSFDQARQFFRAGRDALHAPRQMQDMDRAAERLAQAIRSGERVLVYGDYDVDGTTATALFTDFLRRHDTPVDYFIPDRYEDGYGLCTRGLDYAAEQGAGLVVALDCGITAHAEAAYARKQGLDLIICDHHTTADTLPDALAVLNPKRPDCSYPFDELSGCGVGFKLVQATLDVLDADPDRAFDYLDLLAVSTAADIVPLSGENRILLREGLRALENTPRPGLQAMAKTADFALSDLGTSDIVFKIGPRINAAGRIDHAHEAVKLLLAPDVDAGTPHAQRLETLNEERRTIDRTTRQQATTMAERQITSRNPHALVLYQPDWHLGVIGIVASRIVEEFYRPTIMLCDNGNAVKGSARSISGVNIYNALSACEDVLTQFGGHDYAAGLSLEADDIDRFHDRLDEAIGEVVTPELLTPKIDVDASLALDEIDDRFWAVLKQFGPFGPSNPRPVFHSDDIDVVDARTVGGDNSHLKLKVRSASSAAGDPLDVIGFGMGDQLSAVRASQRNGQPLELLFSVEENTWRGRTTLQLKARDLRLSNEAE